MTDTNLRKKYTKVNEFEPLKEKRVPEIIKTSDVPEGVFALTTIKNFHCDAHDEYVFESEWVFVTREKLMEPRFQQHLAKTEALTNLCKRLSETSGQKKNTMVVAKPPHCHCSDIEKINEEKKKCYVNPFRRLLNTVTSAWRRLYNKIKECLCNIKPDPSVIVVEDVSGITNSYLCR